METEQEGDGEMSCLMDKMFVGGRLLYSEAIMNYHLGDGSDKLTRSSASLWSFLLCSLGNPGAGRYSGGMLYGGGTNGVS